MNNNLTEIVFILDRSGSMAGLEGDTVGGFNAAIAEQKGKEGTALVSTVLFHHESTVFHDRVPIDRVSPMTRADYRVGGLYRPAGCHRRGHPPHRQRPQVRPPRGRPRPHRLPHHH